MTNIEQQRPGWFEIGLHLTAAVEYSEWRDAPWLRDVITDGDEPGRVRAFELIEAPHIPLLESAVRQWLDTDELPTLSHPTSYLLALRFATIGHLLMSFSGVFPPPSELTLPVLYERFLLEWWRKNGGVYGVGFSCSEYDIEA
jgi:hypothetical protein